MLNKQVSNKHFDNVSNKHLERKVKILVLINLHRF